MSINIFEQVTRAALRFESPQGSLTVEDLWRLPLTAAKSRANLDDIARDLHRQLKVDETSISFVKPAPTNGNNTQLAFDVVKHIIDVRMAENEVAATARANAEKKQQLLGLIAQKEFNQLADSSLDDLKALAASL